MRKIPTIVAAAALALLAPAAASAQGTADNGAIDTSYGNPQPEEDDGFPWGLLGLLGLAGLLPRKRKDHVDVDHRTRT
jgi:MYXO-CTERM domain-containing protein